jgi:acyl carrier protein
MEKQDFVEWITQWMQKKTNAVTFDLDSNFFSNGLLNSFETLQLVMDIESSLQLSLPDSALTDARFSSVNGLADILFELS